MKKGKSAFRSVVGKIGHVLRSKRFWRLMGVIAVTIIVIQLVLPYDRAFVLTRVDGVSVGLKTDKEITQLLNDRYKSAVVVTKQPATRTSFIDAGLKVDSQGTAERVVKYPVWQRLIPLSSLTRMMDREHSSRVNYLKLSNEQWASDISSKCYVAAHDASVEISQGKLTLKKSAEGAECPQAKVLAQLKAAQLSKEMGVEPARTIVKPKRSDEAVRSQLTSIQKVIDQGVSVKVLDSQTAANPSEIVSWLKFSDGLDGRLVLDVDPANMAGFIARVQQPVYIAPGTTVVTVRDGQEVSRSAGAPGRGVDSADLVAKVRGQLQALKTGTIEAKVAALAPREQVVRSYTNSAAGLQALVTDIAKEKGDMAIALTELDGGQGRSVSANGSKQYHPASTYKLFISYSVIKRIEANSLKWSDGINGTTVDECLTRMIVNSDNACAESFADKFSWKTVQSELKALGMTGTNLNAAEPVGTVSDQVLFLQKLHTNQLMKPENKNKLLALMKRQVYRAGIPSGIKVDVADKVGFLGGYLHDSGLVYSSHGVYALSIYSKGGSWGNIADAARRIEALLAS